MKKVRNALEDLMAKEHTDSFDLSNELASYGITSAEFFEYMRNPRTPRDLKIQKTYSESAHRLRSRLTATRLRFR